MKKFHQPCGPPTDSEPNKGGSEILEPRPYRDDIAGLMHLYRPPLKFMIHQHGNPHQTDASNFWYAGKYAINTADPRQPPS